MRMLPFLLDFLRISINANTSLYLVMLFARPASPESLACVLPPHFQKALITRFFLLPVYLLWFNAARNGVIMAFTYSLVIPIWSQETLSHMAK